MAGLRVVEFVKSFHLGGTEVQVVELLRGLPAHHRVKVAVLDEAGPLLESVWKLGFMPSAYPLNGSVVRPNTALQIGKLALWLSQQRTELVHVHDFYSTLLAVPAAKLAGCKVIVGRLDLVHWHSKAQRAILEGLTRMADHVIVNAGAIRKMLIEREGVPAERISIIHNGLDLARFDARMREGLQAPLPDTHREPVVVHVANMNHAVKRQEDLIAAIARLGDQGTRLHAFLVGDGPRRRQLAEQTRRMRVEDRVHFLGHRTDVPAIYKRATMGVLCSSAEGLSNAVMEGMAACRPMVVTAVGGNPDLIAQGDRGLVVQPGAPDELASAFAQLLADRKAASRMGRRARAFVERELSLQKMVGAHEAVYFQVARGAAEQAQAA